MIEEAAMPPDVITSVAILIVFIDITAAEREKH
ncbi:hypothetical protein L915_08636 [Phytophthora nicotianae]|uniref:Uncharacterized protein n=1 Tax=Phytophthora nicotianae TaxID=4792 RepID=W2NDA8_PHYNI|nr:hypothetical protein L915_08636 [Phytophthora nicotianae]ETL40218.1 hypothetical protein L916_08564 [Phytophthora nicotianae]ETM46627.1 hypothetical protein L914_08517 [Phytophthora nicotianae]